VGAAAKEVHVNEWLRQLLFLPEQASTLAKDIDYLHYFVIITTMLGAAAVALATLYYIVRYREGTHHHEASAPGATELRTGSGIPFVVELTVFGGLLALFVLWWVIGFRQYVQIAEPPANSMTIYVTGKQWMWSFAYPNGTGSNGVLYVPVGRPVKLVLTSRDVIHSFFVPAFRVKKDVVPGQTTTMWFEVKHPGRYSAFCAEYCGADHSMMRAEVVALSDADYERMLEGLGRLAIAGPVMTGTPVPGYAEPKEALSLAKVGERVAARAGCFRCHTDDGTPHIGPTWAGLYGATIPLDGGTTVIADDQYLTASMMDPAAQVHLGFPPVMPSYQGLLTAPEIGALVEYIRTLRDVPRRDGTMPLPEKVPGNVPIVHPLPAAGAKP
jgi:cytochrome c oxidase subunit 2